MTQQKAFSSVIQQHLKPILEKYDKDHNSNLEKEELRSLLADNLGVPAASITQDQLDWHFDKIDEDHDGKITFEEYFNHFFLKRAKDARKAQTAQKKEQPKKEQPKKEEPKKEQPKPQQKKPEQKTQAKKEGDNQDQLIDIDEFKRLIQDTFKPLNIKITQQMIQWNFNQIDKDHSGRISFEEFLAFIKKYNK